MRLAGRIALVTAAGSGMGRAGALRFAEEGAYVVVTDVDLDAAKETIGESFADDREEDLEPRRERPRRKGREPR